MGFVFRRVATAIAGVGQNAVAEVIDAHLEMLSMIFLTTAWAISYGWFEATAEDVGKWFRFIDFPWPFSYLGHFSTYHLMMAVMVFAITFSFGFLKFTRMLYHRKRYMLFTALGSFPYSLALEDFAYFFFSVSYARLNEVAWTCSILSLGCWTLKNPWFQNVTFVFPRWYFVAFGFSAVMFFLAYRSALVNLLVTQQVMKELGFVEKFTTEPSAAVAEEKLVAPSPASAPVVVGTAPTKVEETKTEQKVSQIIDAEREDLMRRLRERLERGS